MTELRRSYDEGCIAAHALDLVGDRWALLIARELFLGPRRFSAIRAGLPGISANILTQRLSALEGQGLLTREPLPPPAGTIAVYALTDTGRALWPVVAALARWGAGQPGHDPRRFISPAALMLSMAAEWRAVPLTLTAGFLIDGEAFSVTLDAGRYRVTRGAGAADLSFAGSANRLARVVYGPQTFVQSLAEGGFAFTGDPALARTFLDGFDLARPDPELPF